MSEDAELLEPVRRLVDERPTYGYRRIGALLNRERLQNGLARLNHKRIYRLMAQNGLLSGSNGGRSTLQGRRPAVGASCSVGQQF
jgi:putative transposase